MIRWPVQEERVRRTSSSWTGQRIILFCSERTVLPQLHEGFSPNDNWGRIVWKAWPVLTNKVYIFLVQSEAFIFSSLNKTTILLAFTTAHLYLLKFRFSVVFSLPTSNIAANGTGALIKVVRVRVTKATQTRNHYQEWQDYGTLFRLNRHLSVTIG